MSNISLLLWPCLTYVPNKSYLLKLENNEEPAINQEGLLRPVVGYTFEPYICHLSGFCFDLVRSIGRYPILVLLPILVVVVVRI